MRLLDNLNSNDLTASLVKDYMKKHDFLGTPEHICNQAKELVIYTQNFIVFNQEEKEHAEELLNCSRPEEWSFPLTISIVGEQSIYSNKTEDFTAYNANSGQLSLFLIQKFNNVVKPKPKLTNEPDNKKGEPGGTDDAPVDPGD